MTTKDRILAAVLAVLGCVAIAAADHMPSIPTTAGPQVVGSLSVTGGFSASSTATPTALDDVEDNYACGSTTCLGVFQLRLGCTLAATCGLSGLTGYVDGSNVVRSGADGALITITNISIYDQTLYPEDGGSSAGARFAIPRAFVLPANGGSLQFRYDATSKRLRPTSWPDYNPTFGTVAATTFTQSGSAVLDEASAPGILSSKPWQSARYYFTPNFASVSTLATLGVETMRCLSFSVPNSVTLDRIGAEVTTIGDVASRYRLGIYSDDETGRPGTLLVDAGYIAGDSATVQEKTISLAVTRGTYWACGVVQAVSVTQPTIRVNGAAGIIPNMDAGTVIPVAGLQANGRQMTSVTGALPATWIDAGTVANTPRIFVRVQ